MIILKEAIAAASIKCSSEHKRDTLTGQFYGYGFLEYGSKEIPFSYNTKTGKIDLTGNPWDWIAEYLQNKPYTPEEKNFFTKYSKEIATLLKKTNSLYFDGSKWARKS